MPSPNRTRTCRTPSRRTVLFELSRTLFELRRTLFELRRPFLSYAAPKNLWVVAELGGWRTCLPSPGLKLAGQVE